MSEYRSYGQKIFDQCEVNSLRASSDYDAEFIDFNHNFSFSMGRVENLDYQEFYYLEKDPLKDTDFTVKAVQNEEKVQSLSRIVRKIEINSVIKNRYLLNRKGTPYETMDLNINFKTRFCQFIRQLVDLKLLGKKQKELFERYKSQSPSFKSLVNFLNSYQNQQTKCRLKELMQSSQIILGIQQSDLKIQNKLTMIKFVQVMRLAVINGNSAQKWK